MCRREVPVREAFLKNCPSGLAVQVNTLGLPVLFVPAQIQPLQSVKDGIHRGLCVAFDVGVVESKNHCACVVASIKPVEDKSPGTSHMEKTGRRGCETYARWRRRSRRRSKGFGHKSET